METLAKKVACNISTQMNYDENKRDVIAYGLTAIFQMVFIFIIITIIGLLLGIWYECIIIYLGVGIIRKSTGGAHSQTMNGCIIISVLSITSLSFVSGYLLNLHINTGVNILISLIVYIICFICFYQRVPVDSPNKPIVKPEKIKKLRKQSFLILTFLFLLSVIFILLAINYERFYSLTMIIRLTMLWQVFTLTNIGIKFFERFDSKLKVIFVLNGI